MAAVSEQNMSDQKLKAATCRICCEWYTPLDTASQHSMARWSIDGHTMPASVAKAKAKAGRTIVGLERSKITSTDGLDQLKAKLRATLESVVDSVL